MNTIWSTLPSTFRKMPIKSGPNELMGLVIKSGKMSKTVTVLCRWKVWNNKYGAYYKRTKRYLVHDEENFSKAGDIVIIKGCKKLTDRKAYYVRNVVKQGGRFDYWEKLRMQREKELRDVMSTELTGLTTKYKTKIERAKTGRLRSELIKELKVKAMQEAFRHLKRREGRHVDEIEDEVEQMEFKP